MTNAGNAPPPSVGVADLFRWCRPANAVGFSSHARSPAMPMKPLRSLHRLARAHRNRWGPAALVLLSLAAALLLTDTLLTRGLRAQVLQTSEASMQTLGRIFVNDHWKDLGERMLAGPRATDPRANPDLPMIDRRVRSFAQGTDILKIKIYGPSGLTLYSSDPAQIGENKADNAGVLGALKGMVASELGRRGTIGAFDGDRHDRDLVSSYVPIRGAQGIEAVIEIYVNRTAAVAAIEAWRAWLWALLGGLLAASLGSLWWWGRTLTRRLQGLHRRLGEARHRRLAQRRELDAVRDRAAALLAQAGTELGAPIRALLGQLQPPGSADGRNDQPTPLPLASLRLLALRFNGLAALAKHHRDAPAAATETATLGTLVAEALAARQDQARDMACTLTAHVDPRLAGSVLDDARRLRDALELLLAGAIALSPSGRVQLKVQASPGGTDIDLTDSAVQAVDVPNLDRMIAASLIESLGASLHTRFTAGVGHWHHLRLDLDRLGDPARNARTTPRP